MKIVADTYSWVEVFAGSDKGERARRAMNEAELLLTPGIVLAELARKYIREGRSPADVSNRLTEIDEVSELSHVDQSVALASAAAYSELESRSEESSLAKPGLFDAVILATARVNDAKVLTGDRHFKGLPDTLWVGD